MFCILKDTFVECAALLSGWFLVFECLLMLSTCSAYNEAVTVVSNIKIIAVLLLETGSPKMRHRNVNLSPNHLSSCREVKHHVGEGDILWSASIIAI